MQRLHLPFQWGVNDCCLFAADVINAMTGTTHGSKLRGKYKDALGAKRVLKKFGGTVETLAERFMLKSQERSNVRLAQRGDLVLFDTEHHGPSLGICIGATAVFTGPTGLSSQPLSNCRRAWRV